MFIRVRRSFLFLCACSLFFTIWLNGFSESWSLAQIVRSDSRAIASVPIQPAFAQAPAQPSPQSTDVSQLVQTGVERYRAGLFLDATEPWKAAYEIYDASQDPLALAVVSENLARAYQQLGQPAEAVIYWEKAITATKSAATEPDLSTKAKLGRLLTEQAQAYSRLGQHRRAIAILCGDEGSNESDAEDSFCTERSALRIAKDLEDTTAQIAALGSLGEAYRLSGDISKALVYLEQGLSLSRQQNETVLEAAILNGLGNAAADQASVGYRRAGEASASGAVEAIALQTVAERVNVQAIAYFQQSYERALVAQDRAAQLRSQLAQVPLQDRAGRYGAAQQSRSLASSIVNQLPDSQMKAFALLKLADLQASYSPGTDVAEASLDPATEAKMTQLLNQVIAIGEAIDNSRVISFALGKLGQLDERAGRYEAAIRRTQAARLAADQGISAQESLYLWDWQMGRILKAQGHVGASVQAYAQAVSLLEQIRGESLSTSRDLQFDFRDTVEPVYRQYAALNLRAVPTATTLQMGADAFTALDNTLVTLDSLRVAELQSYFANDCVIAPVTTRVDAVGDSRATAVISTAILGGRNSDSASRIGSEQPDLEQPDLEQLVVIVSLPDGSKKVARVLASEQTVKSTVIQFRENLELGSRDYIADYDQTPGKQLYQWLIQPFEEDFAGVETLVFVNDGLLRSVPMAALYDGERYLIEKFAVATTPSLTLTAPERVERPTQLSALLMGVSDPSQVPTRPFDPLPAVNSELAAVAEVLPNSKILLNEDFSLAALRKTLDDKDYRILHMATHGTFGFDPKDNFVVMGAKKEGANEFNEILTIGELDALIQDINDPTRAPVELLTLTACETARGDTRATLGLAGVAVRAGVRSAIATLWSVGDASSAQLIADFYSNLQTPDLTKAEALQKAQIAMIRSADGVNQHPYRWAPFVLIGNWL